MTVLVDQLETEHVAHPYERHSLDDVFAAALRVEQAVQERLWAFGGPGTVMRDRRLMRALHDAQWQAHSAVYAVTGKRTTAKQLQLQASSGPPLTVCVGRRVRRLSPALLEYNAPDLFEDGASLVWAPNYGDGCGIIMEDTREPRAPKKECSRCRKRGPGPAKNALARLRAGRKLG
jgi:hypothetical protein